MSVAIGLGGALRRVPVGIDLQPLPAPPGIADAAVERMQHGEGELHPRDRHARGMQPLASAAHDGFEIGIVQRLRHQPIRRAIDQHAGGGARGFTHVVLAWQVWDAGSI